MTTTKPVIPRRVCFDISCSLFKRYDNAYLSTPQEARDFFFDQACRFKGATAFVYSRRRYVDFRSAEALLECLLGADEIITFNGRVYDMIALEKLLGESNAEPLWEKPHHDLANWKNRSLAGSVKEVLPKIAPSFESTIVARQIRLGDAYKEIPELAGTYRDTKFTRLLFDKYLASGDTGNTFKLQN